MAPTRLDAALVLTVNDNRVLHLFKGCWVAAYTKVDQIWEPTGPTAIQRISACWPDLSDAIGRAGCDAAWQGENDTIWLTRGNTLFQYDPAKHQVKQTTLSGTISNLPEGFTDGIDAALNTKRRVYLFKNTQYCSYEYSKRAAGPPQDLKDRPDAAAWVDTNKTAYLFHGDSYMTATANDKDGTITVNSSSPTKITDTWSGAPVGTPTLDIYFFNGTQLTRARTNIELTTYDSPLPGTITAPATSLGYHLSSAPSQLFRFSVTPDNRRAYVTDPDTGTLSGLDLTTSPTKSLWIQAIGNLPVMTVSPLRDHIWTIGVLTGVVTITHLHIQNGKPLATTKALAGAQQGAITVTADATTLYYVSRAQNFNNYDVVPVDAQALTPKATITSSDHRPLDLAVTPDGTKLYVLTTGDDKPVPTLPQVRMIPVTDPTHPKPLINVADLMSVTATPDGAYVLVVHNQDQYKRLHVIATATDQDIPVQLPDDASVATAAVDPNSRYAYIPNVSDGSVTVVDLTSPQSPQKYVSPDIREHPVELGVHWS